MQARFIQLIARYIGLAMTAMAGWLLGSPPDAAQAGTIENLSGAVAAAVVAALLFLADLLLHRLRHGGVIKDNGKPVGASPRRVAAFLMLAMLTLGVPGTALPLVGMTGCATVEYQPGPRADYIAASDTVRDVTVFLRAALADGLIDHDDWVETVNPAIQEVNEAMDDWEAAVLSGRADQVGTARVVAESLITRLRRLAATYQGGA